MNIYRLTALDPRHASWLLSDEQETVWACAPDVGAARALVADKTFAIKGSARAGENPWQADAVTSCVLDPTMSLMQAGTVVRQDGSLVGD